MTIIDFNELFDNWAGNYDETVYGSNNEYSEVFEKYDRILKNIIGYISDKRNGTILEIGVGTGNLTELLYKSGFRVIGVEPSKKMRKIAQKKLPQIDIMDGHFLEIPIDNKVDAIVTSYAFHHLRYRDKKKALKYLDSFLRDNGKIVIADTMFESVEYKKDLLENVQSMKALNLLNDLNTEYYEYLDDVCSIFKNLNYTFETRKMNKYVWIISAKKGVN